MPGVGDTRVIDLVTHRPEADEVVLVMTETRPWGRKGGLLLDLQAKFRTYLDFVETGRLATEFPNMAQKRVRIRLDCATPPGPMEQVFLQKVRNEWLRPAGVELEVGLLGPDGG